MKACKKLFAVLLGFLAATMLIYWFNLENKLIFYGVRPVLARIYDKQKRDVRL